MATNKTDVMIVGTGAAGLFCALNLPENISVRMITKDKIETSDSYLAQGGIATLKTPEDYNDYFEDTVKAGHYKNQKDSVDMMIKSSPQIIQDLIDYGVEFEQSKEGLSYTKEGGHSQSRILHHKDITGQEITSKLLSQVRKRKNIRIDEYTTMVDIICENNVCKGVVAQDKNKEPHVIYAKVVVFATGGIGGLFQHSTNYQYITGDALAIAMNHKIELQDINYIQIHPTALYSEDNGRRFLISESVRGEGAILLNPEMKRFVDELLPRDVVTAAMKEEMQKFGIPYVYLSMQHLDAARIKARFPNIYQHCLEEGYDFTTDLIPVTPAQHYFMGGIKVDLNGRTSMENLFAIGETSCNGVHGENRLGSNSLLESLVFSKRAADVIKDNLTLINHDTAAEDVVASAADEVNTAAVDLTFARYDEIQTKYKQLIFNEIKRRDNEFYERWCSNEDECR